MSARWLIAFGVFIVVGVGAILLISSPPAHVVFLSPEGSEPARPGGAQGSAGAASSANGSDGPVMVTPLSLDFGSVPILFPSRESFFLVNQGRTPVGVKRVSVEGPFHAETTIAQLDPNSPKRVTVMFDPKKPGKYEQRLRLTIEDKRGKIQELEVLVSGRAVLSPQAAGIAIPPPPDQVVRTYQAQKAARELAAYREATENMQQVSLEDQFPKFTGPAAVAGAAAASGPEAMAPVSDAATSGGVQFKDPDHVRSYAVAAIMAFGEESGPNPNDIPVPLTGGETTPDLPPGSGEGDDEGGANPPDGGIDQGEDGSGGQDPGDDDEQAKDDNSGIFVIAPNSSVVVYSNKGAMPLQALPLSINGSMLQTNARMVLPEFMLAFGEYVTLEQFGPMTGSLSPDGTVVMNVALKLEDSGGGSIVLPLQLTTEMAVGYSAAGRMFFDSGSKRNPLTGDVKMVGIANIPIGQGSAIEKAPVYFALLGRIQL